jgi:hypothetical protein
MVRNITLNTKFNWGCISYSRALENWGCISYSRAQENWGCISYNRALENRSSYKLDFKHPIHKTFGTLYAFFILSDDFEKVLKELKPRRLECLSECWKLFVRDIDSFRGHRPIWMLRLWVFSRPRLCDDRLLMLSWSCLLQQETWTSGRGAPWLKVT